MSETVVVNVRATYDFPGEMLDDFLDHVEAISGRVFEEELSNVTVVHQSTDVTGEGEIYVAAQIAQSTLHRPTAVLAEALRAELWYVLTSTFGLECSLTVSVGRL